MFKTLKDGTSFYLNIAIERNSSIDISHPNYFTKPGN